MRPLLDTATLESSAVVANSAMNRDRQLDGVNSYTRELGFNPLDWLLTRADAGDSVRVDAADTARPDTRETAGVGWLDLCCGSGRALNRAADRLHRLGRTGAVTLTGVDLVDYFESPVTAATAPRLVCASVAEWTPTRRFDLITCVHGLHYVGDKLGVLTRAAGWLTDQGRLVADLDLSAVRLADGQPAGARLTRLLRAAGFTVDRRRHRISRSGPATISLPYRYLGADDRAGPNYTGQPAVNSYYTET
ncbi:class I SAM-dependent methyltransferase [Plantactinospora sonchi]|uniref:Methyltransferase domain-containing protein n=1 Tax=Plantactinospora sonchi TaxID=1544735 RepID=A0ABU7RLQ8_9ACTN